MARTLSKPGHGAAASPAPRSSTIPPRPGGDSARSPARPAAPRSGPGDAAVSGEPDESADGDLAAPLEARDRGPHLPVERPSAVELLVGDEGIEMEVEHVVGEPAARQRVGPG